MSERLTAEQVAEKLALRRQAYEDAMIQADEDCDTEEYEFNEEVAMDISAAIGLVRKHLVPQWQDEPSGDGWYWVESIPWFPMQWTGGRWVASDEFDPSAIRRVCPIQGPPSKGATQ